MEENKAIRDKMTNSRASVAGTESLALEDKDTIIVSNYLDTPVVQASCCLRILTECPQQALSMDTLLRPFLKHLDPQRQCIYVSDSSALLSPDAGPIKNTSTDQMAVAVPDVNKYFLRQNIRNWLINAQARANIDAIDSMMDGMFGADSTAVNRPGGQCCQCHWGNDELSGVPLTTPAIALVLHLRENSALSPAKATALLQEPPWRFHHKIELSNTRGGKHRCKARQEFYCTQSPQMLMSISTVHCGDEVLRIMVFTRNFKEMVAFYRSLLGLNTVFIRDNFCLFTIQSSNGVTFQIALKYSPKLNPIPSKNCFLKINSKAPVVTFNYVLNETSVYPVDKHCLVCDPDGNLVLIDQSPPATTSLHAICSSESKEEFVIPSVSVACSDTAAKVSDENTPCKQEGEADGRSGIEEGCDESVSESWLQAEAHRRWEDALIDQADHGAAAIPKTPKPEKQDSAKTTECELNQACQTQTVQEPASHLSDQHMVLKTQTRQETVVYESLGEKNSMSNDKGLEETKTFAEFVSLDDVMNISNAPKNSRNHRFRATFNGTRSSSKKNYSCRHDEVLNSGKNERHNRFNDFQDELKQAMAVRADCLAVDRRRSKHSGENTELSQADLDKVNSRRVKCLALDRESMANKDTRVIHSDKTGEIMRRDSFRSRCLALENIINNKKLEHSDKDEIDLPQYNYRPSSFLTFDAGRDNKLRSMAKDKDVAKENTDNINRHRRRGSCNDVHQLTRSMSLTNRNCACARCRSGLGHGTDAVDASSSLVERRAESSLGIHRDLTAPSIRNRSVSSDNLDRRRSLSDALHTGSGITITAWGSSGAVGADRPAPNVPVKQASCTNLADSFTDVRRYGVTHHSCGYLYGSDVVDATALEDKYNDDKPSASSAEQRDITDGDSFDEISDLFPDQDSSVCGADTPRPESQFSGTGSESQYPVSDPMWSDRSSMDSGRHTLEPGSSSETERDPLMANMQDILLTAYTMDSERQQCATLQQSHLRAKHKFESKGFKFKNKKTKARISGTVPQKSDDLLWYSSEEQTERLQRKCGLTEQETMTRDKRVRDKMSPAAISSSLKPWEFDQSGNDAGRL